MSGLSPRLKKIMSALKDVARVAEVMVDGEEAQNTIDDRAVSGDASLYYGVPLDDGLGFTTPWGQLEAVGTTEPIALGCRG